MVVEFLERPGDESIRVSTNDGSQHVTLAQTGEKGIRIIAAGPVAITAERDATVTASGDVSVSGTKVEVAAQAELKLSAPKVSIEGATSLDLSGAKVSLAGKASAEVSSSGPTVVSGSVVKIN
jgi:hypothetical protein